MDITRRDFMKAVAVGAVLPVAGESRRALAWTVNRRNMWSPDRTSAETLARCDKIIAADPNDVLALVHRGQISAIYYDSKLAWNDLTKAVSLEGANPAVRYIRGTCGDVVGDLQQAIGLLTMSSNIDGMAMCSSQPDLYEWRGTDTGDLLYMSHRELGFVLEEQGQFADSIATYRKASAFEAISQDDLKTWAESSFDVGIFCRAIVEYDRLIAIEPRDEFVRQREECWARIRGVECP